MSNKKNNNKPKRLAEHLQGCVVTGQLPQWMTKGRTVLLVKDEEKGTLVSNFRPTFDWHDDTSDL